MYLKIIINILLGLGLVIMQLGFITALPWYFNSLNIVLVVLVFILGIVNLRLTRWWALGIGVLIDIFSFLPFGLFTISLLVSLSLAGYLLNNFFTNRSLYTFVSLTIVAMLSYQFIINSVTYLWSILRANSLSIIFDISFLYSELMTIALNIILVVIIFYPLSVISRNLRPVFLSKLVNKN